jgi:hypothetical protein
MKDGPLTLGLVLTLSEDPALREALLCALHGRADVALGALAGRRLPLSLETRVGCDQAALDTLNALPGVSFCDVVFAHFDDNEDAS